MFKFWKGKKMVDYKNENTDRNTTGERHDGCCGCECCRCKKIFMALVVLLLAFIAGIMVGSCCGGRHMNGYDVPRYIQPRGNMKVKKLHRGMHETRPATQTAPAQSAGNAADSQNMPFIPPAPDSQPYPAGQFGGFVIEVGPDGY